MKNYSMERGFVPTGLEDNSVEAVSDKALADRFAADEDSTLFDELLPAARKRMFADVEVDPTPGEMLFEKELDEIENERLRLMCEQAIGWAAEIERNAAIRANEKRRQALIERGPVEPEEQNNPGINDEPGLDPDWVRNSDPTYVPKPSSAKPVTATIRRRVSQAQIKAAAIKRLKEHELSSIAAAIRESADQVERGQLLMRAQQNFIGHGEFLPWLATIPMTRSTAYRAIDAAAKFITNR
jgi:hypothetical protein